MMKPGEWGDVPVLLRGHGPSGNAEAGFAAVEIAVSPRSTTPLCSYYSALDPRYVKQHEPSLPAPWKTSCRITCNKQEAREFYFDYHGAPTRTLPYDYTNIPRGHSIISLSSLTIVALSKILTSGPVVLLGCDLGGAYSSHLKRWKAFLEVHKDRVYRHACLTGPLTKYLDIYKQ